MGHSCTIWVLAGPEAALELQGCLALKLSPSTCLMGEGASWKIPPGLSQERDSPDGNGAGKEAHGKRGGAAGL